MLSLALAGLAAILVMARKRQWRYAGALAALLLAVGLSSCGLGNNNGWSSPKGTFKFTVTANSGPYVVKTYPLTLIVH